MAISALIPELWAASLFRELRRENIWLENTTDMSSEVEYGDRVNIGQLSGDPTVTDYVRGTELVDPEEATDVEKVLILSQKKYFNILVHDIDEVQTRPALMEDWSRKAGVKINETIDSYVYSVWSAGAIPAAQKINQASLKADLSDTDANVKLYVTNLLKLSKLMDDEKWPTTGRWVVVPSKGKYYINKFLIDEGRIGTGEVNNDALVQAAVAQLFGFRLRMSLAMPNGNASGNYLALGGINSGAYYAQQIAEIEAFRPEAHFADAVKGLFVYGALLMDGKRRVAITHT